ncbi:hypothetical protein YC2023_065853 [Brassica napus]
MEGWTYELEHHPTLARKGQGTRAKRKAEAWIAPRKRYLFRKIAIQTRSHIKKRHGRGPHPIGVGPISKGRSKTEGGQGGGGWTKGENRFQIAVAKLRIILGKKDDGGSSWSKKVDASKDDGGSLWSEMGYTNKDIGSSWGKKVDGRSSWGKKDDGRSPWSKKVDANKVDGGSRWGKMGSTNRDIGSSGGKKDYKDYTGILFHSILK